MCAYPEVDWWSPERILKRVVFPAPLIPNKAKHSPVFIPTDTYLTASKYLLSMVLKTFLTLFSLIT